MASTAPDEAAELREALQSQAGVRELSFDLLRGLMIVEHDESAISRDDLIAAAAKIGLRAEPWRDEPASDTDATEGGRGWRSRVTVAGGALLGAGFIVQGMTGGWSSLLGASESPPSMLARGLFIASAVIGGSLVLPKAWLVLLTILGHANLWTAIVADMGVSLVVVFNALRLLRTGAETMIAGEVVLAGREGR